MTYAIQRDAIVRTRQDLLIVGVRECQNFYAALVQQLLTRTEEIDNAAWVKTSVTVTADAVEAIDATTTAESAVFDATSDAISQTVAGTAVTSKAFTGSVFLKIPSGTQTVTVRVRNVAGTQIGAVQVTLTTSWQRVFIHKLFTGVPVDDVVFEVVRLAGDNVTTLHVWGANLWRNPADVDRVQEFPYRKRVAEAVGTVSVNASRCNIADMGDGLRCFYSRPTCQDPDNFNAGNTYELTARHKGIREYRFCRKDAAMPFTGVTGLDVSPTLVSIPSASQEIDAERSVTIAERVSFEFDDEADPGTWSVRQKSEGALYNTQRGVGTFWRRWGVIYRNYSNPESYVERKSGFIEAFAVESDFQPRGRWLIENLETRDRRIKLVCLTRTKLARQSIPSQISDDNIVVNDVTAAATTIKVTRASEISSIAPNATDWFVVLELEPDTDNTEKVTVTAIDYTNNNLTVLRGRWGTVARAHQSSVPFREIAEFGTERPTASLPPLGKNPVDIIIELYRYAGLPESEIDIATLQAERDTWMPSTINAQTNTERGASFRRTVTDTKKIEDLIKEIRELTLLFMWTNDSQQVTGKFFAPPLPTETVTDLSDDEHLLMGSIAVDDNEETRLTRAFIAYNWDAREPLGDVTSYKSIRIALDVDSEEREYYGDKRLKVILTEWIQASDTVTAEYLTTHLIDRFRHGMRLMRAKLEIKDEGIQIGSFVRINTKHIQDAHGNNLNAIMHISKRRLNDNGTIDIEALDTGLFRRYWFYAPDGLPSYDSATTDQRKSGFLSGDDGFVGTGVNRTSGYGAW